MNMSYCRFQNTVIDLADCLRALEEIDFNISELSEDEAGGCITSCITQQQWERAPTAPAPQPERRRPARQCGWA